MLIRFFVVFILLVAIQIVQGQSCTTIGQLPSSAFPVCGTTTFHQQNVPLCSTHKLNVPGCSGDGASYQDRNPFWYKFTCYASGSLGFLITPSNAGDDYDWQLYDITGHDPNDVFTNNNLIVTGNWAGTFGKTGASSSGVNFIQCASIPTDNKNSFSSMPQLIKGHTYLLLISHFTDSQSGYNLSFGGGTAVITDPTKPLLSSADPTCSANAVHVKISKHIKCSSIDPDGSDFIVGKGSATAVSATGIGCASNFDTDSLLVQFNSALSPGNYFLTVNNGGDNNTLLDYCDNAIPLSDTIFFTVNPILPTPMDSIVALQCAPDQLHLVFKKGINCNSIAADGSDFNVSGTYPVGIINANGNCTGVGSSTKDIFIHLSQPLQTKGNFILTLKQGSDGNTLVDECGQITPVGSTLPFSVMDTVNADFTFIKAYGCSIDTIHFFHPGGNDINNWQWDLDEGQVSTVQNANGYYNVFNQKKITLTVSNGFCSDTSSQMVLLENYLKADFLVDPDECPNEPVHFTNNSQGHIISYNWNFGDGGTSFDESPAHTYLNPVTTRPYLISVNITDSFGCNSTAQKPITIYSSCYIAVPTAFTPNNDGKNDFLHPLNAVKAEQLEFRVYNRWGQLVFQTKDWKRGWDGTLNGVPQATGIYVWFLHFIDKDSKKMREMKGTAALIR